LYSDNAISYPTSSRPIISELSGKATVKLEVSRAYENVMYRGEYLEGYAGETVSVRYDPRDITTIWIYRQEKQQEVFLTRAHAQGLETEQLSVDEAKASAKRLVATAGSGDEVRTDSVVWGVLCPVALSSDGVAV
jgi:hypothetical protein